MLDALTAHSARALLSPSARLLLAAAVPDGASTVAAADWRDVHWPTLLALAAYERAESQLDALLRQAPAGVVPDEVRQSLRARHRVSQFHAAELADAAGDIGRALDAADGDGLWLKGAALAMRSPAGFAVRAMGDIDLLVRREHHTTLRARLCASGWRELSVSGYCGHHHGPPLRRGGATLELHDQPFPPGHPFVNADAPAWFGRAERVRHDGSSRLVPCAAWHLVHAAVHWAWSHEGAVGSWQFLRDAAALTASWAADGPEWRRVTQHAGEIGAAGPVGWALWASSQLASTTVPGSVLVALRGRARRLDPVAERAWVLRVFHSPMASPSVAWSRWWWRQAMRGLGDGSGAWPWRLGRTDVAAGWHEPDGPPPSRVARPPGVRLTRWRRHLGRLLSG